MTRHFALVLLALLFAGLADAQGFRRGVPLPPPPPPGNFPAVPADVGLDFGGFGGGQFQVGAQIGGPLVQPPPGFIDPLAMPGWVDQGRRLQPTRPPVGAVTIYRLYAYQSAEPLFTDDFNEAVQLVRAGLYRFEGAPFFISAERGAGLVPLGRGVRRSGTHFLSANPMQDNRGRIEKIMGGIQTRQVPGWVPLYEWYNQDADLFLYTTDPRGEIAPAVGYRPQGAIGFVIPGQ